jgi:hypothetical protein
MNWRDRADGFLFTLSFGQWSVWEKIEQHSALRVCLVFDKMPGIGLELTRAHRVHLRSAGEQSIRFAFSETTAIGQFSIGNKRCCPVLKGISGVMPN